MATENDPKALEIRRQAWLKMRQQGKLSFILLRGVLYWGGIMFVMFACFNAFMLRNQLDRLPRMLAFNAVIWFLGGLAWSYWVWHASEKRFGNT